jgi:hypothetical protein
VYPIPTRAGATLHLKWNGAEIAQGTGTLIDLSGKTAQTLFSNRNIMTGSNHDIQLTSNLAPGVYWILLQGKTEQIYKKILIL